MVQQDLYLAAAARVAVERARYRGRYGTDDDSLAAPQPDPRSRRDVPLHRWRLRDEWHAARVSHQWQVKSREVFVCA